ncbi:MAG: bidirectional hydrogenase complex protein HoxE [Spirochaetes bacterium]|nr:bidirectional hydrogenase complex protein HoxE [Spirochaetota bacterium]
MTQSKTAVKPPTEDKRWRIVEATIRRNGAQGQALIEVLHSVQEVFGYLDDPSLVYVAKALRLPLSKVYGVATFYHFFTLKPQGKHTCVVCMGTACYIKGAPELLKDAEKTYGVKPGQTTPDGELSVIQARCIGSCSMAPAVVFDGQVAGNLSVADFGKKVESMLKTPTAAVPA